MSTKISFLVKLKNFILVHRVILIILLCGFVLRLAMFYAVMPWQDDFIMKKIIMIDAEGYQTSALSILNTGSLTGTGTYRTPGYPLFLALVYSIFGAKPWIAIFIQIFIGVVTIYLVYKWSCLFFNENTSRLAAFLYAVEPHVIVYGACLLTETLFVFITLQSMYLWYNGMKNSKMSLIAVSALLMGYTSLIRPITLIFPVVMIFLSLCFIKSRIRFRISSVFTYTLLFFLVMSSWMYKNYRQYGHFSLTHINGFNLLYVSAAYTEVAKTGKSYVDVCRSFDALAEEKGAFETKDLFVQSDIFSRIGFEYIISNPLLYARRHAMGMTTLFTNLASTDSMDLIGLKSMQKKYNVYEFHNYFDMVKWYFTNKTSHEIIFGLFVSIFLVITYLSAFFGAVKALREKLYLGITINIAITVYFCFMTGVFGVARYRLPLIPFYIIFSAYGIISLLINFKLSEQKDI